MDRLTGKWTIDQECVQGLVCVCCWGI